MPHLWDRVRSWQNLCTTLLKIEWGLFWKIQNTYWVRNELHRITIIIFYSHYFNYEGTLLDPRVKKSWIRSSGLNESAVLTAARNEINKRHRFYSNF